MARILFVAALCAAGTLSCGKDNAANNAEIFTDVVFQLAWNDGASDPLPAITVSLTCKVGENKRGGTDKKTFERSTDELGTVRFGTAEGGIDTDLEPGDSVCQVQYLGIPADLLPQLWPLMISVSDSPSEPDVFTLELNKWLADTLADLQQQITDAQTQNQARLDVLQQQLDALTDAMGAGDAGLLAAIQAVQALVTALQESSDANSDAIAALEALVNTLQASVDGNQAATMAAIAALQAIVVQLATDVATNDAALLAAIQALTGLVNTLQTDLDAMSDQLTAVTTMITDLGAVLDALSDQVDAGNTALQNQIQAAQDALAALQLQITNLNNGTLTVGALASTGGGLMTGVLIRVQGTGVDQNCVTALPSNQCPFSVPGGSYQITASLTSFDDAEAYGVEVVAQEATPPITLTMFASGGGPVAGDLVPQADFYLLTATYNMAGSFYYYTTPPATEQVPDANTTLAVVSGTSVTVAGLVFTRVSSGTTTIRRTRVSTGQYQDFDVIVP